MAPIKQIEKHPPCLLCGNASLRRAHSKDFKDYVTQHCPGFDVRQAMRLVHEGEEFVQAIQQGKSIIDEDPTAKLAPFMWYLMYQAVVSKEAFSQGTFVIKDPGHLLEKFFSQSKLCYRRWMSHFPSRTTTDSLFKGGHNTFAIDVEQDGKSGLPANKRTVIWSRLKTIEKGDYTFFKIEDWGFTGLFAKLRHTRDYLLIIPSLVVPSWFGKHYKNAYREEYLPPDIYKKYHTLMKSKGIKHTGRDVTKFGLSAIAHSLAPLAKKCDKSRELLSEIYKSYPDLRDVKVRTGREVIFRKLFTKSKKSHN